MTSPATLDPSGKNAIVITLASGAVAEVEVDMGDATPRTIKLSGPSTLRISMDPVTSEVTIDRK